MQTLLCDIGFGEFWSERIFAWSKRKHEYCKTLLNFMNFVYIALGHLCWFNAIWIGMIFGWY